MRTHWRWNNAIVDNGPALNPTDTIMVIIDKDDKVHNCTVVGGWSDNGFFSDAPYVIDSKRKAIDYMERNEFLLTDEDFRIPRCNIKSVKMYETATARVQPQMELRGIRNWDFIDFVFNLTPWIMGLFILALFALLIFVRPK